MKDEGYGEAEVTITKIDLKAKEKKDGTIKGNQKIKANINFIDMNTTGHLKLKGKITGISPVLPLSLSIDKTILPEGEVGTFYDPQTVIMTASGGTPPYRYDCYVNNMYGPRAFANGGSHICVIDNIPKIHGSCQVNFSVTDSLDMTVSADPITLYVNPSTNLLDNWHWRNPVSQAVNHFFGVTYGNGTFVAVGDSIFTSPDGSNWLYRYSLAPNYLWAVTHGNGLFVGVGENGTILTSPNGITWMNRISGVTEKLSEVTYGDHSFVAVGSHGTILTSSNGTGWIPQISGTANNLTDIVYGNGLFVAVGNDGVILTSPDSINWAPRESGISEDITGVTYGNGLFIAVTWSLCPCGGGCGPMPCGSILTSPDGVEWTIVGTQLSPFLDIAYGNGIFIALSRGRVFYETINTSYDSMLWRFGYIEILDVDISERAFEGIAYGNSTFVAVGQYGTIIQSDPIP